MAVVRAGSYAPGDRALGITDEGRDRRLAADSVAQVQHPVALDHRVRVFEQMLGIDRVMRPTRKSACRGSAGATKTRPGLLRW